ncbi:MAG: sigma-70 family RNA polymerase sigma factor [Oscillospiraceae bacterium]|nr:sigma-70 family RNA polymerase sigma factor [Oscillospiraceae bacterium]
MDELKLIGRAKKGDRKAFESLVKLHEKNVYNLALKLLKNREDALDAAQDAFLKAWISIASFRGDSKFSAWLYRLTYNTCLDVLRKAKKGEVISLTSTDEDEKVTDVRDDAPTPEEHAEKQELRKTVRDAVDALPEDYKQIIIMREFTGFSYGEIAEATGLSDGTVKSRLSRARQKLAEILRQTGTFSENDRHKNSKEVTDCE